MTTEVSVLRVFTDGDGKFGSPLGVVSAGGTPVKDRYRIAAEFGYGETVFVDDPTPGVGMACAEIYTPAVDLLFTSHSAVGAAWWLRERGISIRTLQLRAGVVGVGYAGELVTVQVFADWTPEYMLHQLDSPQDVVDANPADYSACLAHCVWAWIDKSARHIRSRAFAPELGVEGDEATGAAAIRITEYLGRSLTITQGTGSVFYTGWRTGGWVEIGGRAVHDGRARIA
ncbi:MAG TPA: PhzF family phenazine biosynthesis protein [Mycobacterium sp.]|nr:PhzF family phenazine biosynthesis protein [Mycobacterium sp.]